MSSEIPAPLHIPALCDVEVASALRRLLLRGILSEERVKEALADYLELPLARHGHQHLLARILNLRTNFSAYDATCIARQNGSVQRSFPEINA